MSGANWWYDEFTDMYVCGDCNEREFGKRSALFQHLRAPQSHAWCKKCDLEFESHAARLSHYLNSSEHSYCRSSDGDGDGDCDWDSDWDSDWDYSDDEELEEHESDQHAACDVCDRVFDTASDRDQHAAASHWYCKTHQRFFQTSDNLRIHLMSRAHVAANVKCPTGCGRAFISHSAAASHLESGRCSSGIDRIQIDYYVAQWDRAGLIRNSRHRQALPAPPSSRNSTSPSVQHFATEASYSPHDAAYKCWFDGKFFGTLHSLNQHLASATHTYTTRTTSGGETLYHCPNLARCDNEFLTLSGLVQHVEQGNCGARSMRSVMDTIEGVMGGMRSLTI
ncbi:hypothetical protein JCM11491_003398 [Sporobolomyces phaffii]